MTWEDVCALARALPSVELGSYHGYPALRVEGKFLTRLGDDLESLEFKAIGFDERELMIEAAPDVFHLPPRYHGQGVFARLSALDEARLRNLLMQRWRRVAPRALVRAYEAANGSSTRGQ